MIDTVSFFEFVKADRNKTNDILCSTPFLKFLAGMQLLFLDVYLLT